MYILAYDFVNRKQHILLAFTMRASHLNRHVHQTTTKQKIVIDLECGIKSVKHFRHDENDTNTF